jgi:hypothetical protein
MQPRHIYQLETSVFRFILTSVENISLQTPRFVSPGPGFVKKNATTVYARQCMPHIQDGRVFVVLLSVEY